MASGIHQALKAFDSDDLTPKMVRTIFKAVPYAPELNHYSNLQDAAVAVRPDLTPADLNRIRGFAKEDEAAADILWMANLMDMGDKGYAVVTGLMSAWKLFKGAEDALELDPQQRNDAVLKALGLSYMVYKAYPGTVIEKAEAFRTQPAGKALAMYYASIEVALPFADNVATSGGSFVKGLFDKGASTQLTKLTSMAGGRSLEGVSEMLGAMTDGIGQVVEHAAKYTKPVAESVAKYAPSALKGADRATGMAASVADMMPVYRYLGARLAAESIALRAFSE